MTASTTGLRPKSSGTVQFQRVPTKRILFQIDARFIANNEPRKSGSDVTRYITIAVGARVARLNGEYAPP
jgi:hypothetical protein